MPTKEEKAPAITLRLPPDLRARLVESADKAGVAMNAYVAFAIREKIVRDAREDQ